MPFSLETFFFDTPIYTNVKIDNVSDEDFLALYIFNRKRDLEGYNPWRKTQSTFSIITQLNHSNLQLHKNGGYATLTLQCKRYGDEFLFYVIWDPQDSTLFKIGQFPTVADFHIGEVKQYNKVIANDRLRELTKAIGLASNGVGIGSFVYLRRIFEHLIFEAYTLAKTESKVNESDFNRARMDQKIALLQEYLPIFLVENKEMYSILSLGIHELDEKTCLAHFDTLRVGIEIILDEKLDEFKKREKIESAKKKISDLKANIRK